METWILAGLAALNLLLLVLLLLRKAPAPDHGEILQALASANERTERELRHEIGESARGARQETSQAFATFQQ
ncbi:MAG: DNA recombination protein RmuC, partial [Proteobacteria bacterium]|nr:DNA recombination protein RmuC [Pseudomonadota bacterium]